ncbi:MAG: DUF3127 domain-containing protein [Armatimonadetes bacterium]|nr:DUF3127 domain-containing protein [Akkermansiaceae bacterium]
MYEVEGKIKVISEAQNFPSGFTKREFVVTTGADKYPQDLKFEVVKDKCALLDDYKVDQEVTVSFDIRGNEYNGKYYVNLACWKIQAGGGGSSSSAYSQQSPARGKSGSGQSAQEVEPAAGDLRNENDFDDDDIPF